MIKLRPVDWDDPKYDGCVYATMAVLDVNGIRIPLCEECVEELSADLKAFNQMVFCHKCEHAIPSKWGWSYGGSCRKKAETYGKEITDETAGYECCVGWMDTCDDATPIGDAAKESYGKVPVLE